MISILIPVFNRDVNKLVVELSNQLLLLGVTGDITVMDDGSSDTYRKLNGGLSDIPLVRYFESGTNYGRILARQRLAQVALYEWLLYLDCDSSIVSSGFIENYYSHITDIMQVCVGGRIYSPVPPVDCGLRLHWTYGSRREVTRLGKRGHANRFMSNNFLISKTLFQKLDFKGGWKGYGYEDTWMGMQLEQLDAPVNFIDNPVLHNGLETAAVFIYKTSEALGNLRTLSKLTGPGLLARHVKLYKYYCRFRTWKLLWLVNVLYFITQVTGYGNLYSCNPSMIRFDLYRLYRFSKLNQRG